MPFYNPGGCLCSADRELLLAEAIQLLSEGDACRRFFCTLPLTITLPGSSPSHGIESELVLETCLGDILHLAWAATDVSLPLL